MKKDHKMSSGPPVKVNVTPLFRQGNQVICAIEPQQQGNAKGGMLRLDRGRSCTVEFSLLAGSPDPLAFSANGAFEWASDDCPRPGVGASQPYSNPVVTNEGLKLTVSVGDVPETSAVHYRLNFDNHLYFDPIIIRD